MVFSSSLFLFYFLPVFFSLYLLFRKEYKNYLIVVASILFYSWGAPEFVVIVIASVILNFYIVNRLNKTSDRTNRRLFLILSVSINLGLLGYFKYFNFFIDNVNLFLANFNYTQIPWIKIGLPIGISFFTFQLLSYTIDVYRKVRAPLKDPIQLLLYILMFPQLIAGPIIRFDTIAEQITDRSAFEAIDYKLSGFIRFIIGLSKKVLIANVVGEQADIIFSMPQEELTMTLSWIAALAYTFQIYYDFSGYSDMAIGLGRMMGFRFPENFNNPYISENITEFWQRWHISLSTWFRDYLFLPVAYYFSGRMRKNKYYGIKTNIILYIIAASVTFILCGFWHGAAWNFVIWGAYHGVFIIMDKLFLKKVLKRSGKSLSIIITFVIVVLGWVIFRIENISDVFLFYSKMFSFDFNISEEYLNSEFISAFIFAVLFSFITLFNFGKKLHDTVFIKNYSLTVTIILSFISIILFVVSSAYINSSGFNPFIYFRF